MLRMISYGRCIFLEGGFEFNGFKWSILDRELCFRRHYFFIPVKQLYMRRSLFLIHFFLPMYLCSRVW
jgi:hypothetical protein